MAQRQVVELIDDLDGKVLDQGETVSFGLDGVDYQIDLSDKNAAKLREYEVGLNAVAAPLRGIGGSVVAAVSVSGPSFRLTRERIEQIADRMVAAAAEISARLGYWR